MKEKIKTETVSLKDVSAKDVLAQVKKYTNRKNFLSLFSIAAVIFIAIMSSIPNLSMDFTQIATAKFVTKTIMQIIIGVTCMACMTVIGQTSNAENPTSNLFKARVEFRKSAEGLLEPLQFKRFKQWVMQVHRPSEQRERDISELRHCGLTDERILSLTREEIELLKSEPYKKSANEYYSKLTEEQYKVVIGIKDGKTALNFLAPTDYLSETNKTLGKTREEILSTQFQKRTFMYMENIVSKILMIIAIGVFFGSIFYDAQSADPSMSAGDKALSVLFDIGGKLFTAIVSSLTGFLNGEKFNDYDSEYLKIKLTIHNDFKGDPNFKAKTDNELAREEWLKHEKEMNKIANEEYAKQIGLREEEPEPEPENESVICL